MSRPSAEKKKREKSLGRRIGGGVCGGFAGVLRGGGVGGTPLLTTSARTTVDANAGSASPTWYAAPVASAVTSALCEDGNPPLLTASEGLKRLVMAHSLNGLSACATTTAITADTKPMLSPNVLEAVCMPCAALIAAALYCSLDDEVKNADIWRAWTCERVFCTRFTGMLRLYLLCISFEKWFFTQPDGLEVRAVYE